MHILIDGRALLDPAPLKSGVYTYVTNVLDELFCLDRDNQYTIFLNSFGEKKDPFLQKWEQMGHVSTAYFSYPNKLFNLALKLSLISIDTLVSRKSKNKINFVFFPHLQFIKTKAPYILAIHDLSFIRYPECFSLKRRLWHRVINPKKLINNAAKIIASSKSTKQEMIDIYKTDQSKIEMIHLGVKSSQVSPEKISRVKQHLNLPDNYVFALGTVEPRKNLTALIKGYQESRIAQTNCALVIAGAQGWSSDKLETNKNIIFLGRVSKEDKPALYAGAKAFIYPSIYEGFGLPPLEAMEQGTPVITSASSSLGEVVGDAGILINPYNVESISSAITNLIENKNLAQLYSDKGKARAKQFSWADTAKKTLDIFSSFDRGIID